MTDLPGAHLEIVCNGCGELMRDMGEWPIQFPRDEYNGAKHVTQAIRYCCKTCRMPSDSFKTGHVVGIAIVGKSQ